MKIDAGRRGWRIDLTLIVLPLALSLFGLLMISSATRGGIRGIGSEYFVTRQAIWIGAAFVAFIIVSLFDARKLRNYAAVIYIVNLVLLGAVLLFGDVRLGAQRWLSIGPLSIQPSEYAKLFMALFFAAYFANRRHAPEPKDIALSALYLAPPVLLVFAQPDLGTSVVLCVVWFATLVAAGARARDLFVVIALAVLLAVGAYQFGILHDYQVKRLMVFLDPSSVPDVGYNLEQAKIAIGSGGLFGKGLYAGTQTSLRFIPERHSDFIFSVIGEELGFVGAIGLFVAYLLLVLRVLFIAYTLRDRFMKYFAYAYASMFVFHVLTNVGMNLGIMPITGIPLPFVSSGGTFLFTNVLCLGVLESAWRHRFRG